jgi:hypothetical protein
MKNRFVLLILFLALACSEKKPQEIYQGKLEELIVGDFGLIKDSLTKNFWNLRIVTEGDSEFILYTKSASKFKGWAFIFASTQTGKEVRRIEIPTEGPEAIKAGVLLNIVPSISNVFIINYLGDIADYNESGKQASFYSFEGMRKSATESLGFTNYGGLITYCDSTIQMGRNPNRSVNSKSNIGPGELKTEFSIDFNEWLISVDLKSGTVKKSIFKIPDGYEVFKNDPTSTRLYGAFDSQRDKTYLMWPGSSQIFILKKLELLEKITPKSKVEFNYLPAETIPWGANATVYQLPKEGSQNIFLLFDSSKDLIIKCTKINESGVSETNFERTKHYVLSIYSGDWEPKGEYFFDFETELEVENWFLTSEGLFINKPKQKSEDEYEFWKIDLSRFGDN